MDPKHAFDKIDLDTFNGRLSRYPDVVSSDLADLEQQRLHTIPERLHARNAGGLTKDELVILMDWKLSHGKFRPSLKKLINENDAEQVSDITTLAFDMYDQAPEDIKKIIAQLCRLRGVGPATASLIMSVKDEDSMPFFSDELFRWAFWNKSGWEQSLKYTAKEYLELHSRVQDFRKRLDVPALSIEKVAYVLGKTATEPPAITKSAKRTVEDIEAEDVAEESGQLSTAPHTISIANLGFERPDRLPTSAPAPPYKAPASPGTHANFIHSILAPVMSTLARLASFNAADRARRAQAHAKSEAERSMASLLEEGRSDQAADTAKTDVDQTAARINAGLTRSLFAFALCLVMVALLYLTAVDPDQLRRIWKSLRLW